jgi:uncharacterized protein (DUF342 family)
MGKSIVSKGKNIKEAVNTALDLLDAKKSEVDIEVMETESKGVFGIGTKPAIVRVTIRESAANKPQEETLDPLLEIEKFVRNMDSSQEETSFASKKHATVALSDSDHLTSNLAGKVWVKGGQIYSKNAPDQYPIVCPTKTVKLFVNDVQFEDKVVINEGDITRIEIEDEMKESDWEIKISDDKMKATMNVKVPGTRIYRKIKDHQPDTYILLEAEERKEPVPIDQSFVLEELRNLGVTFGMNYNELAVACHSDVKGAFIIAKGVEPTPGQHGHFQSTTEVDIKKGFKERLDGTVDYKETQEFPSVEQGEILGNILPPIAGKPGRSITGEPVLPPEVFPATLQIGKGAVIVEETKVIATDSGHPEIKIKGKITKISVISKLIINKDITLETGNVHYIGEVEIHGSVQDGMVVDAQGNVSIRQNVNRSKVYAGKSIVIKQNIISGEVTAGKNSFLLMEVTQILEEVLGNLKKMVLAIEQLSMVSAFKVSSFTRTGLGPLIKILCDGKFKNLSPLIMSFINKVNQSKELFNEEWVDLTGRLYKGFILIQTSNLQSVDEITNLINKASDLYQSCQIKEEEEPSFIQAGFTQNSQLQSSGDIFIVGKGCYNSILHAGGFIRIEGHVRSGEIHGNKGVFIEEAASPGSIPTKIKVPRDQMIEIRKAREDTVIQIGPITHRFMQEATHVRARLDEDGILRLH